MTAPSPFPLQKIITVSELNHLAKEVLELSFPLFWLSGEVSNFTRAASGHWYFSLKDANAQVRCVMFKGRNSYADFTPKEGDCIEARCTVTLYEARGDYQINVEFMQKAGLGMLFEAYEKLKCQLQNEGLFDAAQKKAIPKFPRSIGIITSPDGAALHDVLTTLARRNSNIEIVIYPTPVQGKGAAATIARAIKTANDRNEVDTLIVCRGGGSLEDLWQFNEEIVARAMVDGRLPVISGVGHETDFTICDFIADARAATPTAAAELASSSLPELREQFHQLTIRLQKRTQALLAIQAQKLDYLAKRLISPMQQLALHKKHSSQLQGRLDFAMRLHLQRLHQHVTLLENGLRQMNPHAILERGYAIVEHQGAIVSNSQQVNLGDKVRIQLRQGSLDANISYKD